MKNSNSNPGHRNSIFSRSWAYCCACALFCFAFAGSLAGTTALQAGDRNESGNDYRAAPVFFEMFYKDYCDSSNLMLLPEGKIHIYPFGTRDISNFTWEDSLTAKGAKDFSWWVQMESLRHMLPFIRSANAEHRQIVQAWFDKWYESHKNSKMPNKADWYKVSAAMRAMVLVCYLSEVEKQVKTDETLIARLHETLIEHRDFLSKPENFDQKSNHGMWEAIGLFELTRAFPNSEHEELALERLQLIVNKSVSQMGLHKEHSVKYLFHFLDWLYQYTHYLKSLPNFSWSGLEDIKKTLNAMVDASYFMQDHKGNIPNIGDTDEEVVLDRFRLVNTTDADGVYFDSEAGFAVYKDNIESKMQRYIILNIQNQMHGFPYHYHDDAMALYYSYGGEVILGDQGRYDYSNTIERNYLNSQAAHNKVISTGSLYGRTGYTHAAKSRSYRLVTESNWLDEGDTISFSAKFTRFEPRVTRKILIPKNAPHVKVVDYISGKFPVSLLWNIGPDVKSVSQRECTADENGIRYEWILKTKKKKQYLMSISASGQSADDEVSMQIFEGSQDPMLGWYSPSYAKIEPSKTILLQFNPANPMVVEVISQVICVD
jgi:hypothetical protein